MRRMHALTLVAVLAAPAGPSATLDTLLKEEWEFRLRENPLEASGYGDHRYDGLLPSVAPADLERQAKAQQGFLDRAARIDRSALSPAERINYDMWRRELADDLLRYRFGAQRIPILADSGFHIAFADLPSRTRLGSVKDYESYIARLRAFPAYMDQNIAQMREGLRTGFTQPQVILEGYDKSISAHVVDDVEQSVFMKPFATFPVGVPDGDRERLRAAGRTAVKEAVVPAYARFLEFMRKDYVPGARKTTGASDLPQGREYYAALVKSFTTLDV